MEQDILIIIGSGNHERSDLEQCKISGHVFVAGDALAIYEKDIDGFAMWQVDPKMFNTVMEHREKEGLNTDFDKYTFFTNQGFERISVPSYGAGDVMYAIQVGLHIGYDKIVLVDCPLDGYEESYQAGYKEAYESLKDKVRSMSGFTKELFGEPTKEWFNS